MLLLYVNINILLTGSLPIFLTKHTVGNQIQQAVLFLQYQHRYLLEVDSLVPSALG